MNSLKAILAAVARSYRRYRALPGVLPELIALAVGAMLGRLGAPWVF